LNFHASSDVFWRPVSDLGQAQILLDGAQLQLGFAERHLARFPVGSHKVFYAKLLGIAGDTPANQADLQCFLAPFTGCQH
jgi:hypothetical protein